MHTRAYPNPIDRFDQLARVVIREYTGLVSDDAQNRRQRPKRLLCSRKSRLNGP